MFGQTCCFSREYQHSAVWAAPRTGPYFTKSGDAGSQAATDRSQTMAARHVATQHASLHPPLHHRKPPVPKVIKSQLFCPPPAERWGSTGSRSLDRQTLHNRYYRYFHDVALETQGATQNTEATKQGSHPPIGTAESTLGVYDRATASGHPCEIYRTNPCHVLTRTFPSVKIDEVEHLGYMHTKRRYEKR